MTEDLTEKCGSFNSECCRYAGRERMHIFIIKQVHEKSLNVTITRVTKGIQRSEDMSTFIFFSFYYSHYSKNILVLPQSHL